MQARDFFPFDADYVRRLAAGESETERHFVGYFSRLLLIKIRSRLRLREDAEDLRQEVFLRVLHSLRQGRGLDKPECLGAYVNSICNYVIFEHLRARAKSDQWDENAPEPRDPGTGIEGELVSRESRLRVRRLVDEMPSKERALLMAVFLEERDKDAVCHEQGVNRDYLRVLLHRAKKRFRELLIEDEKTRGQEKTGGHT